MFSCMLQRSHKNRAAAIDGGGGGDVGDVDGGGADVVEVN